MSVETHPRLMTAEELLQMPDDGMRHELVEGVLTSMSPAGLRHGRIAARIAIQLGKHVLEQKLGEIYVAEPGFRIARDPDTVRVPDVAFLRSDRATDETKFFHGPPDLAVEVLSPSDTASEVEAKVRQWLQAGTRMVIVVDPEQQTATVHTANGILRLTADDTLDGGDVVPGWRLLLSEIFAS